MVKWWVNGLYDAAPGQPYASSHARMRAAADESVMCLASKSDGWVEPTSCGDTLPFVCSGPSENYHEFSREHHSTSNLQI